jgi:hypothetical protein
MKIKNKIILLTFLLPILSFAQTYQLNNCFSLDVGQNCEVNGTTNTGISGTSDGNSSSNSSSSLDSTTNSNLLQANNTMQNSSGSYNSSVPGGNVFAFCSAVRPPKPLSAIWDAICPAGKASSNPSPAGVSSSQSGSNNSNATQNPILFSN